MQDLDNSEFDERIQIDADKVIDLVEQIAIIFKQKTNSANEDYFNGLKNYISM